MAGSRTGMRRPSQQTIFVILMIASAALLLLPWDILGRLRNVTELMAVPQWAASEAAGGIGNPLNHLGSPSITAEEHAKLVANLEAAKNENVSLAMHVNELAAQVNDLTQIRNKGFPRDGRLIPAKIIAADAVASRGSLTLSKGRVSNAKAGDWVTSRRFIDAGANDGVGKGAGVLARESLIGWIEETEAFTSRVVLLSDALSRHKMLVHIVRENPGKGRPQIACLNNQTASFSLEGAGRGLMKIPDIDAEWVKRGVIQVGDVVTSDANDPKLPVAMVIGEITALEKVREDKKKPLYYTAMVKHRYDPRLLGQVFIADYSRRPE